MRKVHRRMPMFRSGICIQAAFPSSYSSALLLRLLRSTVVTRFFATMSLSDSRPGPFPRLFLPSGRWRSDRHLAGSPRFLDRSIHARCPLSPRKAQRLHLPITSSSVAGFITLWRTGHFHPWCNEAESGSLALRLACLPYEASPAGLLRPTFARLSIEWAIDRMNSFQFMRSARLVLALQRTQSVFPSI